MKLKKINDEVFVTEKAFITIGITDLESLKKGAAATPRKRARICAHRDMNEPLHEMMIVMSQGTYVRPHRHVAKAESFLVLEGRVDAVFFHDDGKIKQVVSLGDYGSGRTFYYRLDEAVYHTLLIRSEQLVIHEATVGPFDRSRTQFAPWAPDEMDKEAGRAFLEKLDRDAQPFLKV